MLIIYGNNVRIYRCENLLENLLSALSFRPSLCVLRHHLTRRQTISIVNFAEMLFITEWLYSRSCYDVYHFYHQVAYLTLILDDDSSKYLH